jgi:hypothetical protein
MKTPDPFRHAKEAPLRVLLLFSALAVFWTRYAVTDLLDGAIFVRGVGMVTAATEPGRFWLAAAAIAAAGFFVLCQIGIAADSLLNRGRQ